VPLCLVPALVLLFFYVSTFRSMCAVPSMAVFCSYLLLLLLLLLLSPGGDEIFRTRPNRPWGPPNLLYNNTESFPEVKRPGRGVDHPPPSSAEVEGRVELYICSPSGLSWRILG